MKGEPKSLIYPSHHKCAKVHKCTQSSINCNGTGTLKCCLNVNASIIIIRNTINAVYDSHFA